MSGQAVALQAILAAVAQSSVDRTSLAAAELRRAAGELAAAAERTIKQGVSGEALAACFDLAYKAGATLTSSARVRSVAMEQLPGAPAVAQTAVRLCLVLEARIVADTTVRTRNEAQTLLARMNAAFSVAEDGAADLADTAVYLALVSLHAAVTRDLVERGRTLPERVRYVLPISMPSLALANRLYGDGSRSDELIAENAAVHPAFMAPAGVAFSR